MHLKRMLLQQALGRHVLVRAAGSGAVCLTFDDGPNPQTTPALLQVLQRHGVLGSFFMVGREVRANAALAQEVCRQGHELGNHTLTHPRMDRIGNAARALEIDAMDQLLQEVDGKARHLFRPPYGHMSVSLLSFCVRHGAEALAYWSRDSMDYTWDADRVVAGFRAQPPRAGDILLFHDDGPVAAAALDQLLPMWKASGLTFATLSQARAEGRR